MSKLYEKLIGKIPESAITTGTNVEIATASGDKIKGSVTYLDLDRGLFKIKTKKGEKEVAQSNIKTIYKIAV
ncbi:hypothetical protein HYY69_00810 [Candidatus Woesearchaeota archaeon]|nr:hypothetical protein [Candidatus Woesearchaeota archaeon]